MPFTNLILCLYPNIYLTFLNNPPYPPLASPLSPSGPYLLYYHRLIYYKSAQNLLLNHPALYRQIVLKVQFKRKGSWVNLRRLWPTTILTRFGHSRPIVLSAIAHHAIRYKKHLFYHGLILLFSPLELLEPVPNTLIPLRALNPYTLRGIRPARYILQKRQGKISQYKHLKSKIF